MHQQPLGDFAPELLPELSQYHTPQRLAERMVEWAMPVSQHLFRVLEPSAGGGNIVRELVRVGSRVTAFEVDPRWVRVLQEQFDETDAVTVREADFLRAGVFHHDLAVMNPPLDQGEGLLHVKHALGMVPRVVTLLRSMDLHGGHRFEDFWHDHDLTRLAILSKRPRFGGDHSAKSDFVVADICHIDDSDAPQTIEHWPDTWA